MPLTQHAFCSYCGVPFAPDQAWPRLCGACGQTTYRNPLPVTIVLVPVDQGLLLVRRGISPRRGWLAFPGGFVDLGESWQAAGVREVWEETGLLLAEDELHLMEVAKGSDATLIIVGRATPRTAADLPPFQPGPEVMERVVTTTPRELAFDLHSRLVAEWFGGQG